MSATGTVNPILLAVDTTSLSQAARLVASVASVIGGVKLGLEFFHRHGLDGVAEIARDLPLFLDLKLHDIPNTVAGAVAAVAAAQPDLLTIHAAGGAAMIRAAREAADPATRVIAVTVLTSLDESDLAAVGQHGPILDQVRRLADLAQTAGADGVVCSPLEVAALRAQCGSDFILVVPGIRPLGADRGDQKRVMSPSAALTAGASPGDRSCHQRCRRSRRCCSIDRAGNWLARARDMSIGVKVCGLSTVETVDAAIAHGALFVGFVFYGRSPRVVTPPQAHKLAYFVPPQAWSVGLFVDADDAMIGHTLEQVPLRMLQLHGAESPERVYAIRQHFQLPVMKAIRVETAEDVAHAQRYIGAVDWLLFDAKPPGEHHHHPHEALPGGNGVSFDWHLLAGHHWPIPWMLAGGLNPGNLAEAVNITGARYVDVSSGVETGPGIKDKYLIRDFLEVAAGLD